MAMALLHLTGRGQDEQDVPSENPVHARAHLHTLELSAATAKGLFTSQKLDTTILFGEEIPHVNLKYDCICICKLHLQFIF